MNQQKLERLINLIAMLRVARKPVTAAEIHETIPGYGQSSWDSFKRMFERDKEELREMGIRIDLQPVDAWEQQEGYWIKAESYYLPELDLSQEELAKLWLAASLLRMHDMPTAQSAYIKLAKDAPPGVSEPFNRVSADLALGMPNLSKAFEAVAERRRVSFEYNSRTGRKARTLSPYGLVHRKGAWYVVGLDGLSGEIRSFRIDRVQGAIKIVAPNEPGPEFEVPEGFRSDSALQTPPFVQGEKGGEQVSAPARVRFEPSTAWWVERSHPWLRLKWHEDGSAEASVQVSDVTGFLGWLLWFGEDAEVLEPAELRSAVRERLEQLVG